jgi:CDP-diacylglycerol--serine O-phosphatidyltransferase
LIVALVHFIKSPIGDWRWSIVWMAVVAGAAALMASTVKYRSFKDVPLARRQPSLMVILIALLIWLIVSYSEVVLMLVATIYVVSGLIFHTVRALRHRVPSQPA